MSNNKIKEFQGEYRWLSNFYPVSISYKGIWYPSVEHAYMSAKSEDKDWKIFCANTFSPGKVKRQSYRVKLTEGWEDMKLSVMEECLKLKFTQAPFWDLLVETGNAILEEGNNWGDKFWGVDLNTGEGENNLGKLLMRIRSENVGMLMNEKIINFVGKAKYERDAQFIWGVSNTGGMQMLLDVRGWGAIQNLFKDAEEAAKFQDELGQFYADAINDGIDRLKTKYNNNDYW